MSSPLSKMSENKSTNITRTNKHSQPECSVKNLPDLIRDTKFITNNSKHRMKDTKRNLHHEEAQGCLSYPAL